MYSRTALKITKFCLNSLCNLTPHLSQGSKTIFSGATALKCLTWMFSDYVACLVVTDCPCDTECVELTTSQVANLTGRGSWAAVQAVSVVILGYCCVFSRDRSIPHHSRWVWLTVNVHLRQVDCTRGCRGGRRARFSIFMTKRTTSNSVAVCQPITMYMGCTSLTNTKIVN